MIWVDRLDLARHDSFISNVESRHLEFSQTKWLFHICRKRARYRDIISTVLNISIFLDRRIVLIIRHRIIRLLSLLSEGHEAPRQDHPQTNQDHVVSHRQSVDIQRYVLLRPHASRSLPAAASYGTHHGTDQCFSLASIGAQSATLTHFRCTIDYTKKKQSRRCKHGVSSSHMRKITSRFGTLWWHLKITLDRYAARFRNLLSLCNPFSSSLLMSLWWQAQCLQYLFLCRKAE